MKRWIVVIAGFVAAALAGGVVSAAVAATGPDIHVPDPRIGPTVPLDTGAGEELLVVLGGVYPTRQEAETANREMAFADMAGYYVVPVAQFDGLRQQLAVPGDFALVSVFRTEEGAQEFIDLVGSFGYPAALLASRVRSFGGLYAGLGQEAAPDGSGPLIHPVPESLP
jgi:hypothetical protein